MNKKIVYGAIALTFIVAVLALVVGFKKSDKVGLVTTSPNVSTFLPSIGVDQLDMSQGCDQSYTCAQAANVPLHTYTTTGIFNFSSTTGAVIPNPFATLGTSTITVAYLYGANGAANITYELGTSTLASGQSITNNQSNLAATLINVAVPTSTPFYYTAGIASGAGVTTGSGTFSSIVVAPTESVVLYATSTFGGASSATGINAILNPTATTSVTYKIEWQR